MSAAALGYRTDYSASFERQVAFIVEVQVEHTSIILATAKCDGLDRADVVAEARISGRILRVGIDVVRSTRLAPGFNTDSVGGLRQLQRNGAVWTNNTRHSDAQCLDTDVYSLGVLLYELLVGAQPFDAKVLRKASFDDMRRKIREEEPPKPSTRLTRLGERSTITAKNRHVEPRTLGRELRGDLDWITMKALEKDRTRRYGSPSELAADVGRYLKDEPVLASPPSTIYQARKFIRRHRIGVSAAAAFVGLLIGVVVLMSVQSARIARERDRAEQEAAKSEAVTDFLQGMLGSADPFGGLGAEVTVVEALDESARTIEESFQNQPEIEAAVKNTIGYTYMS